MRNLRFLFRAAVIESIAVGLILLLAATRPSHHGPTPPRPLDQQSIAKTEKQDNAVKKDRSLQNTAYQTVKGFRMIFDPYLAALANENSNRERQ